MTVYVRRYLVGAALAASLLILLGGLSVWTAWAAPAAPAAPAIPATFQQAAAPKTCTSGDTIVATGNHDYPVAGDLIWNEAQIRKDSCGDLRPVGIFENDVGCWFLLTQVACNTTYVHVQFWQVNGPLQWDSSQPQFWTLGSGSNNDVYMSLARGYLQGWPNRGACYYTWTETQSWDGSGLYHVTDETSPQVCI